MSLPPALLQRLAQRGLVQKQKQKAAAAASAAAVENEEVIAEDYDEMETEEQHGPEQFDHITDVSRKNRPEDNFWLERMKARMGDVGSAAGYKGCPNKYNIWHKCSLYCVNRWAEGRPEPSREYMRRYKRLLRKYPLPKGWMEMYDAGCGCFYFCSTSDGLVSWLPPTHPKSQVSKSAATYRRQLEEATGEGGSDGEQQADEEEEDDRAEYSVSRHQREIDDIINASMRPRSPPSAAGSKDFPSLQESGAATQPRKQKSRDLERTISRQRRGGGGGGDRKDRRRGRGGDTDTVDPMDPSAYSDTPRGKWSDGLQVGGDERKKSSSSAEDPGTIRERGNGRDRRAAEKHSDDDEEDYR